MIDYGYLIPSVIEMKKLVEDEKVVTDFVKSISTQIRGAAAQKKSHATFAPSVNMDFDAFLDYEDRLKDIFSREGYSFRPSKTVENHWDICW